MILCDTCASGARDIEDLAVFVSQLRAVGVDARVHVRSVPPDLGRNVQFDLAPVLVDAPADAATRVVLLAAHRLTDERLVPLRGLADGPVRCVAFGTFRTRQEAIGARARLSYVFETDPTIVDTAELPADQIGQGASGPVFGVPRRTERATAPRVLLVAPDLDDPRQGGAAMAMGLMRRLHVSVLTDGRSKREWQGRHGTDLPVFHYAEVLPADLADRVDVAVSFTRPEGNYRLQCLLANLVRSGAALIDATARHAIAGEGDAFVRGPADISALSAFLEAEIVPNMARLGESAAASRTAMRCGHDDILRVLDAAARPSPAPVPSSDVVFVPTNGIGLGHAQRAALVARELSATPTPVFAAFPSCIGFVTSFGFDVMPLVGRSAVHAQSFENDLVNYVRLRALTEGSSTLVFDGGYVFDSIYRVILGNRLDGVWLRRGLWQVAQNNAVALDREKVFTRVVVPREAFEELNRSYSQGDRVHEVGPVVQTTALDAGARRALRSALSERYGIGFRHLLVTLLGGGVAADRSTEIQTLCGIAERRPETLHLVVLWPGGRQQPGWFGWSRTRVVRTQYAGALVAAADLCVAAAGYNLFHEILYAGTPAIFVPQTGPAMDDQTARARAADERGLASLVHPGELMRLEREVARLFDRGEAETMAARIAAAELPVPGNHDAARHIAEVRDANAGLRDDRVARMPARR